MEITIEPTTYDLTVEAGPRGYSAYEVAVQNGFEGTEEEWLETLIGPAADLTTVNSKLTEFVSRADGGDGSRRVLLKFQKGSATSDSILTNPDFNKIKPDAACAGIISGGSGVDPHLMGYGYNRYAFTALSSELTIPYAVADTSKLLVRKHDATNIQRNLVEGANGYTVLVTNGTPGQTVITLVGANGTDPAPLATNERCYVEDQGLVVDKGGITPSYGAIGPGGYDCQVWKDLMNHIRGAHHRIMDGNHNSIFGGSYGLIWDGTYGLIVGGTQNEVGPGAGNGSVALAGLRLRARGATSSCLGGQENDVSSSYGATIGGYKLKITGTATAGCGRENTHNGSDSFFWGRGNLSGGNYSNIGGYLNTIGINHHHSRISGGYKVSTTWQGEVVHWGYRDTETPSTPYLKHSTVYLRKYTTGTTPAKLATVLSGVDTFTPPPGYIWSCTLNVVARTGALKGGAWEIRYACQNLSTNGPVQILGSPTVVAIGQDPQLGESSNAATISVSVVDNTICLNVHPRLDSDIATKWEGILEIRELN